SLPFFVLVLRFGLLARANEIEMKRGRLRRILGPPCSPGLGASDVGTGQQPVGGTAPGAPLGGALQQTGVLAQPVEVSVERRHQPHEAGAKARAWRRGLIVEEHVVQLREAGRRGRVVKRVAEDGDDALAQTSSLLDLPTADFGACRRR